MKRAAFPANGKRVTRNLPPYSGLWPGQQRNFLLRRTWIGSNDAPTTTADGYFWTTPRTAAGVGATWAIAAAGQKRSVITSGKRRSRGEWSVASGIRQLVRARGVVGGMRSS